MTTIVWHGPSRTLAADTLATTSYRNNPLLRTESVYKLIDLVPAKLVDRRGERLLAVGVAGSVAGVPMMMDFIINGLGHWAEAAKSVQFYGGTFMMPGQKTISAILVTSKHTYVLHMEDGVTVKKFPLNDFLAIGSGGVSAYTAYRAFGVEADEAVLAAATTDPSTGFLVMKAKVTNKGLTDQHGHYYNDMDEAILALRKRVPGYKTVDTPKTRIKMKDRFGDLGSSHNEKALESIRKREAVTRKTARERKAAEVAQKATKKAAKVADTKTSAKKTVTSSRRKNKPT